MCGRYDVNREEEVLFVRGVLQEIMERMAESPLLPVFREGEIFPTGVAPVLLPDTAHTDRLWTPTLMRWGFPNYSNKGVVINARQETLGEKPMFRDLLEGGRCVVPANGFYEWSEESDPGAVNVSLPGEGLFEGMGFDGGAVEPPLAEAKKPAKAGKGRKTKHFIKPQDGPLLMAGLWRTYRDPVSNEPYRAYTIITTGARGPVAGIHDRMPLMLDVDMMGLWLDPGVSGSTARNIRGLEDVRVKRVG